MVVDVMMARTVLPGLFPSSPRLLGAEKVARQNRAGASGKSAVVVSRTVIGHVTWTLHLHRICRDADVVGRASSLKIEREMNFSLATALRVGRLR